MVNATEYSTYQNTGVELKIPKENQFIIDVMISRFAFIVPSFKYFFNSDEEYKGFVREWALGLIEAGVCTEANIQNGLRVLRKKVRANNKTPPSISEFVQWCRGVDIEELGIPSERELFSRYQRFLSIQGTRYAFEFKSDLEYWMLTNIYRADMQNRYSAPLSDKELKKMISNEIQRWVEILSQGGTIPQQPELLESESKTSVVTCSAEKWSSRLNALKSTIKHNT